MPPEGCKVDDDRVDAAVLLIFAQLLDPRAAVYRWRKGGASGTAITKNAGLIRILRNKKEASLSSFVKKV